VRGLETASVETKDLCIGDILMVVPGSNIPTDGVLVARDGEGSNDGVSYIDESAFSGEPFPVPKRVGDKLLGGSVNQLSLLIMKVTHTGASTALSKIISLIEEAQANKAPIQAYADTLAGVFAPFVITMSFITFVFWMITGNNDDMEDKVFTALMSAISVVVVACPCAMGLATPTAVMVGTGVGANYGLLIKGGAVLEEAHAVSAVVFDKTGTLTQGKAVLNAEDQSIPDELKVGVPDTRREHIALWLAACAEGGSEHPIARAVVDKARGLWGNDVIGTAEGVTTDNWRVVPGNGVECLVKKDGWGERFVRVGKKEFACEGWLDIDKGAELTLKETREKGHIAIHIGVADSTTQQQLSTQFKPIALFGIQDPLKSSARSACLALRNRGIDVYMCTGDHDVTAQAVAKQVGIPQAHVKSGMTPEGKADFITHLIEQQKNNTMKPGKVAVVGDGINDSVALARADVGIAIGAGTEVAMEAAGIILVRNCLHDVVIALDLSRVVFARIKMNFVWAMGYNICALPFAAGVFSSLLSWRLAPAYAGLMMAFSSVSVVTSSLLLRMYKKPIICIDGTVQKMDLCSRMWRAICDLCGLGRTTFGKQKREQVLGDEDFEKDNLTDSFKNNEIV
jgi:Cu+-exporting ATPase